MSPITSKYKANDMGNPFQTGDEVSLTFPHLRLYWHNGKPDADKNRGVYHYGGWFSGAEDFMNDVSQFDKKPEEIGFKGDNWTGKDGDEYGVYSSRMVYVAPIANRKIWKSYVFEGATKNKSTYSLLGFLAYPTTEKLCYLGPVVLSGSSWSGAMIEDAVKKFPSLTADARARVAPGVPAWQWYISVGTYGDKRITKSVGTSKTSPIVPAQIYTPDGGWTDKKIEKYFVPDDVVEQMIETRRAAEEWLAWKPREDKAQNDAEVQAEEDFPA
jgi:hypothetical protein